MSTLALAEDQHSSQIATGVRGRGTINGHGTLHNSCAVFMDRGMSSSHYKPATYWHTGTGTDRLGRNVASRSRRLYKDGVTVEHDADTRCGSRKPSVSVKEASFLADGSLLRMPRLHSAGPG